MSMARRLQIALLVIGSGLCGSIYVVCPPMLGEFTPVSQRGAVISIYGAIYTLAGIMAPSVMGSVIQRAPGLLDGYMTGFTINARHTDRSGLARPAAAVAQHRACASDGTGAAAEVRLILVYCKLPCAPRTSRPGCAPVGTPLRCVTTPETMVAS